MCVRTLTAVTLAVSAACALAQGGPPMLTDDPGTPPVGGFELNVAYTTHATHDRLEAERPLIDLAYGATMNVQLKIEGPWLLVREGGVSELDLGPVLIGVKWRFRDEGHGRPAVSTFPQVQTTLARRSVEKGLADPGTGLLVPIEVQWHRGKVGFNFDGGLFFLVGGAPEWTGGGAVSTELDEHSELIGELHFDGAFEDGSYDGIAQIGLRRELAPSASFIVAFGRTVVSSGVSPTRVSSYVGIQLRF
ncbi:MAG: hypothetical protein JSS66_18740 [Armatimonadetes bacterium]|nr:hypothetical protein [Armatimonadota bacterium]